MKDRKNMLLAVCFAISLALYCVFWVALNDQPVGGLWTLLMLSFHAVPAFCLQTLLCRGAKWNWVKLIPLCLLSLTSLVGTLYLFGVWGSGWDALGGGLLLIWCVAPAAGCCLGWMSAGHKIGRRAAAAGWVLLLAVYVYLRVLGGPHPFVWHFEAIDIPALIILIAGLYLLFRKTDQKSGGE